MSITVSILDGPLPPADPAASPPGAGAILTFEGVARPTEDGHPIDALDYTTYEPMAQRLLQQIATELLATHALLSIHILHSRGRVPTGSPSLRIHIAAPHRKQALAAMDELIDRLKRDVPIWKSPRFSDAHQPANGPMP